MNFLEWRLVLKKLIRIDKYLADMNVGTRSEVKTFIKKKRVKINGEIVTKDNIKVDVYSDKITIDNEAIEYVEYEYYMINKPSGVVSATTDNKDKTVVELIKDNKKELFPIGRLDKDTEGLLILTNDGELAHNLLSPKKHVDKKYFAKIDGIVKIEHIEQFMVGLNINNEYITKPAILEILSVDNEKRTSEINVTITEGKYHQVKRMFKAIGTEVTYLKRVSMGSLQLDESLELGEYRKLTEDELQQLKL